MLVSKWYYCYLHIILVSSIMHVRISNRMPYSWIIKESDGQMGQQMAQRFLHNIDIK